MMLFKYMLELLFLLNVFVNAMSCTEYVALIVKLGQMEGMERLRNCRQGIREPKDLLIDRDPLKPADFEKVGHCILPICNERCPNRENVMHLDSAVGWDGERAFMGRMIRATIEAQIASARNAVGSPDFPPEMNILISRIKYGAECVLLYDSETLTEGDTTKEFTDILDIAVKYVSDSQTVEDFGVSPPRIKLPHHVLIGSITSRASSTLASILSALQVNMISPASSAPSLADSGPYGFYSFFSRTCAGRYPYSMSLSLLHAIREMGYKRVSILYDTSADLHIADESEFADAASNYGIEVLTSQGISMDPKIDETELTKALTAISELQGNIVVLFAYYEATASIFSKASAMGLLGAGKLWMATDSWGGYAETIVEGSIATIPTTDTRSLVFKAFLQFMAQKYCATEFYSEVPEDRPHNKECLGKDSIEETVNALLAIAYIPNTQEAVILILESFGRLLSADIPLGIDPNTPTQFHRPTLFVDSPIPSCGEADPANCPRVTYSVSPAQLRETIRAADIIDEFGSEILNFTNDPLYPTQKLGDRLMNFVYINGVEEENSWKVLNSLDIRFLRKLDANNRLTLRNGVFLNYDQYPYVLEDSIFPYGQRILADQKCSTNYYIGSPYNDIPERAAVKGSTREGAPFLSTCMPCIQGMCSIGGTQSECVPCFFTTTITDLTKYMIIAITSATILLLIAFPVIVLIFRKHTIMKTSSPMLLCIIIMGCALGLASNYFSLFEYTFMVCMLNMWTLHLAAAIVFGALILKTYRVSAVFTIKGGSRIINIPDTRLLGYLAVYLVVYAGGLLLITLTTQNDFLYKLSLDVDEFGATPQDATCKFQKNPFHYTLLGAQAIVTLIGARIAWKIRNAPVGYSEAKWVFYALINWVFSTLISVVVLALVNETLITISFSLAYTIVVFFLTPCLIFFPKIYGIIFDPKFKREDNVFGRRPSMFEDTFNSTPNVASENKSTILGFEKSTEGFYTQLSETNAKIARQAIKARIALLKIANPHIHEDTVANFK